MPAPEPDWTVLDEAALLWTVDAAHQVLAAHRTDGRGACAGCWSRVPWPCAQVAIAQRVMGRRERQGGHL